MQFVGPPASAKPSVNKITKTIINKTVVIYIGLHRIAVQWRPMLLLVTVYEMGKLLLVYHSTCFDVDNILPTVIIYIRLHILIVVFNDTIYVEGNLFMHKCLYTNGHKLDICNLFHNCNSILFLFILYLIWLQRWCRRSRRTAVLRVQRMEGWLRKPVRYSTPPRQLRSLHEDGDDDLHGLLQELPQKWVEISPR